MIELLSISCVYGFARFFYCTWMREPTVACVESKEQQDNGYANKKWKKKKKNTRPHTTNRIKLNLIDIKLSFSHALWIDDVVDDGNDGDDEREHAMHEYAM